MDKHQLFERAYANSKKKSPFSSSLIHFLKSDIAQKVFSEKNNFSCLEIGVGTRSLLEARELLYLNEKIHYYEGVDFSEEAIKKARELSNRIFHEVDFCAYKNEKKFDLIIDAHCFHTIVDQKDSEKFLFNVFHHLNEGGLFFLETMILPTMPKDLVSYCYSANDRCYYNGNEVILSLFEARELEDFLLKIGFQIFYLSCPIGLKFIAEPFRDNPVEGDPDVMRVILKKLNN